jgi:hypothetical protein
MQAVSFVITEISAALLVVFKNVNKTNKTHNEEKCFFTIFNHLHMFLLIDFKIIYLKYRKPDIETLRLENSVQTALTPWRSHGLYLATVTPLESNRIW